MTLKEAAVELLKVADQIEGEANEVTQFVCKGCNHTSTLASINKKRKEAAKTAGENVTVADITVNDKIHCPACDGVMAYKATEASEQFYFDPEKTSSKKEDEDEDASASKKEDEDEDASASKKEDEDEDASASKKEDEDEDEEVSASKKASIDYDSLKRYKA
jgi:hypothetical protein